MSSKNAVKPKMNLPQIKLADDDDDDDFTSTPTIVLQNSSIPDLGDGTSVSDDNQNAEPVKKKKENFLMMNLDPNLVRRQSRIIDEEVNKLKATPDGRSRLSIALQRERSEMERMLQNYEDSASASYLKPTSNQKSMRQNLAGSISIPLNKMSIKMYGSAKAVIDEQKRLQEAGGWIIHPYSNFRFTWDVLTLLLLCVNVVLIPVAIAFWPDDSAGWIAFKLFSDSWFFIDIFLNFRTGIVIDGPESEVVLDPKQIRRMYLRTWFIIDLIATFPFDVIILIYRQISIDADAVLEAAAAAFVINSAPATTASMSLDLEAAQETKQFGVLKAFNILRLAKIFALLRLLRLSRFIRYFRQWEEVFNVQLAMVALRAVYMVVFLLMISHFFGCIQWMVPMMMNYPEDSWMVLANLVNNPNVTVWEQYSWSIFKSSSHMLCIGYGRLPPQGLTDLWVTWVSMMFGAMCFALFIGSATSLIQSMDASKRAYKEKYMQVKEYMAFRKLPSKLRGRIADYYENRFQGKMFDEAMILDELNHNLRTEVINHNCKELVSNVPFFAEADPTFVDIILGKLKFEVFLVHEVIIKEGSVGDRMYFINRGSVRIKSKHHEREQTLNDGSYFGEISLLQSNLRRVASVIANSYCYMYSLSAEDFQDVIKDFPIQKKKMDLVARERLNACGYEGENSPESSDLAVNLDAPDNTIDGSRSNTGQPLTHILEEVDEEEDYEYTSNSLF